MMSPADIHLHLILDAETGRLFWREDRPSEHFPSQKRVGIAATYSGEAFTAITNAGYKSGNLCGRKYLAHRVVWAMTHGAWPEGEIDHINRVRTDNRPANLRDVSRSVNAKNASLSKANTSGACGVYPRPSGKWCARIRINGRNKYLGTFQTFENALAARKAAEAGQFSHGHGSPKSDFPLAQGAAE